MVSYSIFFQDVIAVVNPLPEPTAFVKEAYDMAWPQILAFMSAVVGILSVILILKSVTRS